MNIFYLKTIYSNKIITLLLLLSSFICYSQQRLILNQNIYVNITNNANLVVDNNNANAITTVGTGGNIISENENNVVKWDIGTSTGNYVVPFCTNTFIKIPLAVNITAAGVGANSSIIFSTYETATDVNTIYPSDVTNMNSGCNNANALYAVDRFWRIDATNYTTKPTPVINFGYNDAPNEIGVTNTITESKLKAERFNAGTSSWETPINLFGIANAITNNVSGVSISPVNFYKSWTLIDTTIMTMDVLATISNTLICAGNTNTAIITPTISTTTNGVITYSLIPNAIISSTNFTVTPSGNTIYTISATNNLGCKSNASTNPTLSIYVSPSPTITVNNSSYCIGQTSATLNASGATTYSWSTGLSSTTGSIVTGTPTSTQTYSLTGFDANGCYGSTTATITVGPTPTISVTSASICSGSSITLTASGATSYSWSNGATTPSILQSPNATTTYSVVGITAGCTSSVAVSNVTVIITPTLTTSNDVTIFNGEQTVLSVSGNASTYSWTPSTNLSCSICTNPIASPKTTIQYCVRGAQQTCTTSACVTVNVEAACFTNTDYSTPNAFTPNNDGNNDTYNLLGWKECITVFYIAIYDRWGEKVFDSDDVTFNWDGTYRGKLLDPAVYVYYIKAEAIRAGSINKKGNITLIR